MEIKNTKTGKKRMLFDAVKDGQNICPKWVPPEDEQEPNESRRYVRPNLPPLLRSTYEL
jgi:hypothetical protein